MKKLLYKGNLYTGKELADFTGVKYTTLMERLRRGYTVEEAVADESRIPASVQAFVDEYDVMSLNGQTCKEVFNTYRCFCVIHHLIPETQVHFGKSIKRLLPNFRMVPTRVVRDGVVKYERITRVNI